MQSNSLKILRANSKNWEYNSIVVDGNVAQGDMTMVITHDIVDFIASKHDRTSCNDTNLNNSSSKITEVAIRGVVVKREWDQHPRCMRCFLLDNLECNLPKGITISASLELVQPEFEIKAKGDTHED
jgi:hypothetical protein